MLYKLFILHLFIGNIFYLLFLWKKKLIIPIINEAIQIVDEFHQKSNTNQTIQPSTSNNNLNILNSKKFTFKEIVFAYISFILITWMIFISFYLSSKMILLRDKKMRKKYKRKKNEES
jgi:large-conductance mechanosensitive channel